MQRPPRTPPVDPDGAPPRNTTLPVDVRDGLGMVDECDRVQRRPEEDDLAAALDDARVRCPGSVPVVEGVRPRHPIGVTTDGGDARLRMPGVDRAGPRAERLGQAAVVASRPADRRVADRVLR